MKMMILLFALVPAFAVASQYECLPNQPHSEVQKIVIIDEENSPHLELWNSSGLALSTPVEYGDDVDSIYYFSEAAGLNVSFFWSEMHQTHEADGTILLNDGSQNRLVLGARCKSTSN